MNTIDDLLYSIYYLKNDYVKEFNKKIILTLKLMMLKSIIMTYLII